MNVRPPVYRFKSTLKSLNGDGIHGLALLGIAVLLLAPEINGDAARAALRYERMAIAAGEWWRLITAHFVHIDLEHTLLNLMGVVLMWAIFARDLSARQWLIVTAVVLLTIDAGLWFRDRSVDWYVGASGALHGFMAAGTYVHVRRGDLDGWILAVFIVLKLGYEQLHGVLPFAESGMPVVLNAHLYGALGGLIAAACLKAGGQSAPHKSL
ncbi:MAG: rhombosortase [Gammaproteobacteria bacterium]